MLPKKIVEICRNLRRNQTKAETVLWQHLRNRKMEGCKFLRQHPIVHQQYNNEFPMFFVADFYCAEKKLVIELDGKIHDFQKDYDQERDFIMREMQLKVLRIKNEELTALNSVLKKIREQLLPSLSEREGQG